MTPTRQRHDGTNRVVEKHETLSHNSASIADVSVGITNTAQSAVSPFFRRTSLGLVALLTAAAFAVSPASARTKTEKLVGVPGWTSGSNTYLRIRPGAETPAVAKVPRHTKVYVWGKFNGWYRVETPDHTFGWVYHQYINAPSVEKVKELSHRKARQASDRTAHQELYGSKEVLQDYYDRYGHLYEDKEDEPRSSSRRKNRLASQDKKTTTRSTRVKAQVQTEVEKPRLASKKEAGRTEKTRTKSSLRTVAASSKTDTPRVKHVVKVREVETPKRAKVREVKAATVEAVAAQKLLAQKQAEREAELKAQRLAEARAAAKRDAEKAEQERIVRVAREKQEREQRIAKAQADAKAAQAAREAAEQRRIARAKAEAAANEKARQQRLARLERERKAREARYLKRLARIQAAKKARAERYRRRLALKQQREKERQRLMAQQAESPSVAPAALRPLSPDELMRARQEYLSSTRSNSTTTTALPPSSPPPSPLNEAPADTQPS